MNARLRFIAALRAYLDDPREELWDRMVEARTFWLLSLRGAS